MAITPSNIGRTECPSFLTAYGENLLNRSRLLHEAMGIAIGWSRSSPRLEERLAFSDRLKGGAPGSYVYATCGTLGDKGVTDETLVRAEQAKEAYAKGLVILCQRRRKGKGGEPDGFAIW